MEIFWAVVGPMNVTAKLAIGKARRFRSHKTLRIAPFHQLGLPPPDPRFSTHEFN